MAISFLLQPTHFKREPNIMLERMRNIAQQYSTVLLKIANILAFRSE